MLAEATTALSSVRADVLSAIRQASAATGSDFDYLLGTAMRESGLKPQAKASTSSASGLFQFVDQTWLGLIKNHGAKHGLGSFASAISKGSDGRYHVDNPADRQAILALKNDPKAAALMEGEYANETKSALEQGLRRNVCNGELYAAHFLGPDAACRLIRMSDAQPNANAAAAFPQAANANRSVFYHADGTARTAREVYDWAVKGQSNGQAVQSSAPVKLHAPARAMHAPSNDWMMAQLYDSTSMPLGAGTPFSLTPGIIDILASLSPLDADQASAH